LAREGSTPSTDTIIPFSNQIRKEKNMEIVYFVLGVVTVLLVLGSVAIVKIKQSIKEITTESDSVINTINAIERDLNQKIETHVKELHSKIDSKTDKIENKIKQTELLKS
jgi:predicted PurR-regulated permease PerM